MGRTNPVAQSLVPRRVRRPRRRARRRRQLAGAAGHQRRQVRLDARAGRDRRARRAFSRSFTRTTTGSPAVFGDLVLLAGPVVDVRGCSTSFPRDRPHRASGAVVRPGTQRLGRGPAHARRRRSVAGAGGTRPGARGGAPRVPRRTWPRLHARFWGFQDTIGLLPLSSPLPLLLRRDDRDRTRARVPGRRARRSPRDGWSRLADGPPPGGPGRCSSCAGIRARSWPPSTRPPQTFVHGDWKMGNLGRRPDGRTILLDWAFPGRAPPTDRPRLVPRPQRRAAPAVQGRHDRGLPPRRSNVTASQPAGGGTPSSTSPSSGR